MTTEKIERFFCNNCKGKTKHFVRGEFIKTEEDAHVDVSFTQRLSSATSHSHSIVPADTNVLVQLRKFFLHTVKNRLADPSEIFALDFKKGILAIQNPLGFSDYRHRSVGFR
jgi:hypothetical protein